MELSEDQRVVPDKVLVRIAGIAYTIISVDPDLKFQIRGPIRNFLLQKATPDMTIKARWDDISAMEFGGQIIFEASKFQQLLQRGDIYIFSFTSPVLGSIPYKVALVNKDFTKGEVLLHRLYFDISRPVYPLEYPLDELLFINFLARGRGVQVHACGVVDAVEGGHLFLGQSGAGKSTIARLLESEPGVTILSDDRIVLRKMENKIWMYGTPWHGEAGLAFPGKAPLTRIYFLTHGQKNELVQQGKAEALARLLACSFPPFYDRDALDFTLGFLEEVVKNVPCYELRFKPDKSVVNFIRRLNYSEYYSSVLNLHH
jgi:hypothetical protein